MKQISQTTFGHEGNCLASSIASVLEVTHDMVPDYVEIAKTTTQFEWPVVSQLESHNCGFSIAATPFDGDLDTAKQLARLSFDTDGYFVVVGRTRDLDGIMHANVWNGEGFQFDPSSTGENGIVSIEFAYVILKVEKPKVKTDESYQFSLGLNKK